MVPTLSLLLVQVLLEVLQAVLDTNFWLATHVVAITLGYAATFLAGFIGIAYLVFAIATPVMRDPDNRKMAGRMIYGVLCFATLLSFVGTVLGGIWADQSWGRFWGWDPKETMSFITWILYAAYLHARATAGWRDHKAAWINILALATMVFNLFFINLVVSGLHSYAGLN